MKLLVFILVVLFAAVMVTLYAVENPGYVLIARAPWSVELPLTLFVLVLLVAFFVLAAGLYILIRLWRIPRDVDRWRTGRQGRRARAALVHGLVKLAEGNWAEAEAELLAGLRHGDVPLLNYLGAACAAQQQGAIEKRDEYLALAHKSAPQHNLAIGMTQAHLQHLTRQSEQSLATLSELRQSHARHGHILKLLAQVYQELRDWTSLVDLIPELHQHNALPAADIDALELAAHRELLQLTLPAGSIEVLSRAWNAVPKHLRRQPSLIAIYARQLIRQNEMAEAEAILRTALEQEWNSALAELYGQVHGADAVEQLDTAEAWLVAHPEEPRLLLALGRLALRLNDSAKARAYLEKCVTLQGPAEAYRELGALLERLGEKDKALGVYRRGLETYASELLTAGKKTTSGLARYRVVR
jgi:HemY protein